MRCRSTLDRVREEKQRGISGEMSIFWHSIDGQLTSIAINERHPVSEARMRNEYQLSKEAFIQTILLYYDCYALSVINTDVLVMGYPSGTF